MGYYSLLLCLKVLQNSFRPLRFPVNKSFPANLTHAQTLPLAVANVMANLTSLNKLPNTRVFFAAENRSVEELELVALFLLKTGTFGAKYW